MRRRSSHWNAHRQPEHSFAAQIIGRWFAVCGLLSLAVPLYAGQPGSNVAGGKNHVIRAATVHARALGVRLFAQPREVAPGVWYVAPGPSPAELRARIETNVNAADSTNADQLRAGEALGLNLSGTGLVISLWDGGSILSTHQELTGRVTLVDGAGNSSHATHVAGTIGATGVDGSARGMAGGVTFRSRDFNSDTAEMAADAPLIDLSNHSYSFIRGWDTRINWGIGSVDTWFADRAVDSVEDSGFGKYIFETQALDQVLADNPHLLSVWAASNDRTNAFFNLHGDNHYMSFFSADPGGIGWTGAGWYLVPNSGTTVAPPQDGNAGMGYDCLPNNQNAKNTLTVGAVEDITADPYTAGNVIMSSFSSWGPADDGRVKPDVVGNGVGLYSSVASGNSSYDVFSGTSMASPNVCGTAALLVEHYRDLNSGALPPAATTKALLIHTAFDAGNFGPDYVFGWGVVDAAAAAQFLTDSESGSPISHHLVETTYSGTTQDVLFVSDGLQPLKATIVWTDPPPAGLPPDAVDDTTKALVNDLDLSIIEQPSETEHMSWSLDPANPAAVAVRMSRNEVDNVEQVLIDSPEAGAYLVRVSHVAGSFTQDYSLLVSGAAPAVAPLIDVVPDDSTVCGVAYTSAVPALMQGTLPVTWTLDSGPGGMTIDSNTGAVSWPNPLASATPYSIVVTATNAAGSDMSTWELTVRPGDFDGDGLLTLTDVQPLADHLLGTDASMSCAADVDLNGDANALDVQPFVSGI